MKFSIKDFFGKCDQIRHFLWVCSDLLKKPLIKNFIFLCSDINLGLSSRQSLFQLYLAHAFYGLRTSKEGVCPWPISLDSAGSHNFPDVSIFSEEFENFYTIFKEP